MSKQVLLVILDGWGQGRPDLSNPIHIARTPTFDYLRRSFPTCLLQAAGIAVGLPWQEPGNSEAGHLTLGCGKVLYQNYPRISLEIETGAFAKNPVLHDLIDHVKKNKSRLHLVGLLSQGHQHAAFDHLLALLRLIKQQITTSSPLPPTLYLHLFLDGKDSPPQSGKNLLDRLQAELDQLGVGHIATLCGRDYGMDIRGDYQVRTQRAYRLMLDGTGTTATNIHATLDEHYRTASFNDNELEPLILDPAGVIQDNDAVLFTNFNADGMTQLARAFADPAFKYFPSNQKSNLRLAALVPYLANTEAALPACYPPIQIETTFTTELSRHQKNYLLVTEQSRAHLLTHFFVNPKLATSAEAFTTIIPSRAEPLVREPLMQSHRLTELLLSAIDERHDCIIANYPAPDAVGHTGNLDLGLRVTEGIDALMNTLVRKVLERPNWVLALTADHGNLETIIDATTGERDTSHNANPVPLTLVSRDFFRERAETTLRHQLSEPLGTLADVAPTLLRLMELPIPQTMEGKDLLPELLR